MAKKDRGKSVLDNVPVKEDGFEKFAGKLLMGIVGHCPSCGGPIYGHAVTGEEKPSVRYSCDCKDRRDSLVNSMQVRTT